jgi:hypothetical protein
MKTLWLSLLLFALVNSSIQANDSLRFTYKNSVQFELGGNGGFYSFNYERIILNGKRFKTSGRVGVAYYPPSSGIIDLWIPVLINEIYSFGKHHIELGLGYAFTYSATRDAENNPSNWEWEGFYTGRLGYRYQKPNGRLILRAAFTAFLEGPPPFIYYNFHASGGVALGYAF